MTSRRGAVLAAIVLMSIFAIYYNSELISRTSTGSRYSIPLEGKITRNIVNENRKSKGRYHCEGQYCHDITLLRGCLIAGLFLILAERAGHYYKSIGWSLFYEIT